MTQFAINFSRHLAILIAVVCISEYVVMIIFNVTGLNDSLPRELEAIADSLLLLVFSSAPVFLWVVKPIIKISQERQNELENLVEALEGAGDAVIITDTSATIVFVNKAFTTITGYSAEEAIGNNPRMLQSGKQSKAFYKMMWRSLINTGVWQGEVWNKRKNGEVFPESLHIKTLTDEHGKIKGYVGIFNDITEQRRQEAMMLQSQKLEAIGTLVGGVAHNFNNMLAGIIGKAYLAKKCTTDPKALENLGDIENISNDASHIVRQLLTFAHENMQQKQVTPIVPLLKEASKTAGLGISEDIEFSMNFTSEPLMVYCDPVEIQQVLVNLINNARDALTTTRSRKISVTVERKHWEDCPRSQNCSVCNADVAHIVVEDTGNGISEANMSYIFDPFFTTKEIGKGTGLGLSMAKGAVEAHGGTIHISSKVGVGTKIEICLPVTNQPSGQNKQKQKVINASRKTTILVIDDDHIVRTTLGQILNTLGYETLFAVNGEEGVQTFQTHNDQISLIITDIVMPVMDGPSAIERIRDIKPDLPVVFITGYPDDKLNNGIPDHHLNASITKPFSVAQLSSEVHHLIQDG